MRLLGYSNAWSAQPGERLSFMVSCEAPEFCVDIVRLYQVDDRPEGPGFREEVVPADCAGSYPGRVQALRTGSYLRVAHDSVFDAESFCLAVWVFSTAVGRGRQGIFGKRGADGAGFELMLDETGRLRFELGGHGVRPSRELTPWSGVESRRALDRGWHLVVAQYDARTGRAMLWHRRKDACAVHLSEPGGHCAEAAIEGVASSSADLLIGALHGNSAEPNAVTACFNGKVASPSFYSGCISVADIERLYEGESLLGKPAARWDLSAWPFGLAVPDIAGNGGLDAAVVNNPTRAVTGPHWDGTVSHFQTRPAHYDAIYFHDDDLDDAGWAVDFSWQIPADLPSGVYAARLRAGADADTGTDTDTDTDTDTGTDTDADEDYVPFIVRPSKATAPVLVVLPTFTYQAYANERFHSHAGIDWKYASDRPLSLSPQDEFSARTPALGCSLYDAHSDGSYVCSSSLRRPVVNFRPKLVSYWNDAGRHFGADMYLVDWLDRSGFAHDVATDHDVHVAGNAFLSQYRVVILGSHPEYMSHPLRRALEEYVAQGGCLMYLGGNGAWWVTDVDPARPHVIEVRKIILEPGARGLGMEPGEEYLSGSGLRGGNWRAAGRPPESLFGVGYNAQGFCEARSFRRTPASFDPRVQFIFEGIGADEVIGDFGLALGGAAGDEFDRAYVDGATPAGTFVLASSHDHPAQYCVSVSTPIFQSPEVQAASLRSDLTYYETPMGGAVFAAGSMCWCTSLPCNGYDNNVSRITANVLHHFLARHAR